MIQQISRQTFRLPIALRVSCDTFRREISMVALSVRAVVFAVPKTIQRNFCIGDWIVRFIHDSAANFHIGRKFQRVTVRHGVAAFQIPRHFSTAVIVMRRADVEPGQVLRRIRDVRDAIVVRVQRNRRAILIFSIRLPELNLQFRLRNRLAVQILHENLNFIRRQCIRRFKIGRSVGTFAGFERIKCHADNEQRRVFHVAGEFNPLQQFFRRRI